MNQGAFLSMSLCSPGEKLSNQDGSMKYLTLKLPANQANEAATDFDHHTVRSSLRRLRLGIEEFKLVAKERSGLGSELEEKLTMLNESINNLDQYCSHLLDLVAGIVTSSSKDRP